MLEIAAYSTMAMTLGLVVARPRIGMGLRVTPAWAAVFGMLLLLSIGIVKPAHGRYALANLWSPFVAISSIMIMTEVAQRAGLLSWWAARIEARAVSTKALFLLVFCLGVMTSSLLNNDAAIVVLTPVVLTMAKRRYPGRPEMLLPFAFAIFMSAGVAALPVSNPMNMVVAEFSGIAFNSYAMRMIPVAAAGWVIAYFVLRVVFASKLRMPMAGAQTKPTSATPRQLWIFVLLLAVLVSYPIAGYLGWPAWAVASAGAVLSLGAMTRPIEVVRRGVPWETLVFLLAVLVMSLGLRDIGLVDRLASLYEGAGFATIGVTSALGSAVLNNHPMSLLNMMALQASSPLDELRVLAALVGGDLGPRLLPMGSLAGLLWFEQLRRHGVELSVARFLVVGALLAVPTIAVSLFILSLYG